MMHRLLKPSVAALLAAAAVFASCRQTAPAPLDYVDPTIGSVGYLLVPTRPTVQIPNQMLRVFPMRANQLDIRIAYFPLQVASHRNGTLFSFLPQDSDVPLGDRPYYIREKLTPYYYASELGNTFIKTEYTTEARSGIYRLSFPAEGGHRLRFGLETGHGAIQSEGGRVITGEEDFAGMKAFFHAELDRDIVSFRQEGPYWVAELGEGPMTVQMKYAISYISPEQARQNLENEIPGFAFDQVKETARTAWEKTLSLIDVKGGTEKDKRIFYTAFYRASERMVNINEYGRYWSNYDHQVHESEAPFYVDNWLWDTYIALEPLHTILHPDMEADKIRSWVEMYRQSGSMPRFAMLQGSYPWMTGNFAAVWFLDAWKKGIRDFDLQTAYEGVKNKSLHETLLPWRDGPNTPLDDFYAEKGFYPGLHKGEAETEPRVEKTWERRQAVSLTTANSCSDWAVAEIAKELGLSEDEALFRKRSMFYRNLFRVEKGCLWAKDKDGKWIEDFDPVNDDRIYFTENNGKNFDWDVKHDIAGLIELMGGKERAGRRLDTLFQERNNQALFRFWNRLPDNTGLVGHYSCANEPCFHIPYMYDYVGLPWKTQKMIHTVLRGHFTDEYVGLPGDEDGGGMSAFVMFSMMGFFPVTPGTTQYAIGSPFFEQVSITLPDGKKFVVEADGYSEENIYIQSATLNGQALDVPFIDHKDIVSGGVLKLKMGPYPSSWGA